MKLLHYERFCCVFNLKKGYSKIYEIRYVIISHFDRKWGLLTFCYLILFLAHATALKQRLFTK